MDEITITWRVDTSQGKPDPNRGYARDGIISVGTVATNAAANQREGESWWWALTATGRGVKDRRPRGELSGATPTKDEAKGMVEARYRELLAADPDHRDLLWDHAEQLQRSADAYARATGRAPEGRDG